MLQTLPQLIDLEEFLDWYPDGYGRFELHDGVIFEIQPTVTHEQVSGFLAQKLSVQIEQNNLPYFIPRQCIIKPVDSAKSGYNPDVIVLDWNVINNEPLWNKRSTITQGETVRLVIELVSTNWQDDYLIKLAEYEKLGISEYWITDYLGLGGRRYIGNPKQPTISIHNLIEGEYQVSQFTGNDVLISAAFSNLNLTANQIFRIGDKR
ncbi:Uma2 family endonuclease [Anabaena aphanizomenioides LEGE 00250]|jgi:Uma2 family endonuclease|uniref:Uma2 family endonuclease n=1 Tax=Sphaerospermopsis aphanizomenoides LEGE 00250 TaxID=2777972 RepID=A0ABR9VC49_9CYAN|nr:Uma2 family endonuclease [Sphaerospermopsis aphanizomenoides]MBE9236058.1 Uma2 family endonuclease [Sphaerospermopsis aphanizomenoides LEGE 00250]